jgi:hypothetical protein
MSRDCNIRFRNASRLRSTGVYAGLRDVQGSGCRAKFEQSRSRIAIAALPRRNLVGKRPRKILIGKTYRFYLTVTPFHATLTCDTRLPASPVPSRHSLAPIRPRNSLRTLHRHTAPLFTTNDPLRTLFLPLLCFHKLTNRSSGAIDLQGLYFHDLTNPFFRKCFIFTSIQIARGCALSPSFAPPSVSGSPRLPGEFLHSEATITAHYPPLTFRNRMIAYETC